MAASRRSTHGRRSVAERSRRSASAKLNAPRLGTIYPRIRLFEILDRARGRAPVVWVSAPAGAGKTTLVASYLAAQKLPHLWYHIDAGDGDPASFFHYLRLAARQLAPRRQPLPSLTPEYLLGLTAFTHNFFRALFDRMKAPGMLVFDGYECIEMQAPLHGLFATALKETPDAMTVIVLSRTDPPPAFARWRASSKFALIDWDMLKLRSEETDGIWRLHRGKEAPNPAAIALLQEQTEGWVSGLTLMLARSGDRKSPAIPPDAHIRSSIFDYFASEIFAGSPAAWKEVLLKTALLPHVDPSVARLLTANPDAEAILADLTRRNYFITKLDSGVYRYHALFREFLLMKAKTEFSQEQWRGLQRKAAAVLIDTGLHEAAAELLQESGDKEGLTHLIYQHAQELIVSGRGTLLELWIRALPVEWIETRPWLSYWLGISQLSFDSAQARACFARAYEQFKSNDEIEGRLLAWCGAVDSVVFGWGNFAPLDPWIDELETEVDRIARQAKPEIAAFVAISAFLALMSRRPQHPEIAHWCDRAWEVAMRSQDPTLRAKIGPHLLIYLTWWIGDLAKAELLLDTLRPLMERQHAVPLVQTAWYAMAAAYHWMVAENPTCLEVVEKGLTIAADSGVHAWDNLIASQGAFAAICMRDDQLTARYLQFLAKDLDRKPPMERSMYYYLSAWDFLNRGQYESAKEHARIALDMAEAAGAVFQAATLRNDYGRVLFYCGDEAGARQAVLASQRTGRDIGAQTIEYLSFLVMAEMALVKGNEAACRDALSACLVVGKRQQFRNHTWWNHDTMNRLYIKALEWDIEPEYVRHLIRLRHLMPTEPPVHLDSWPWPVKLYTLGRFRLLVADTAVTFAGKTQKRPLELLKAIVALGGRDVREERITELLWPQKGRDAAAQALATTVHRLRKLLGENTITRQDGRVSLNACNVWVDAWALERVAANVEAATDPGIVEAQVSRLIALYRGAFLASEDAPWVLPLRERLRNRFLRQIRRAVERLLAAGGAELARSCCEKALEIDPLAESFYSGLMRAYLALNRPAEALAIYERCRKALAEIGFALAAETEALAQDIRRR